MSIRSDATGVCQYPTLHSSVSERNWFKVLLSLSKSVLWSLFISIFAAWHLSAYAVDVNVWIQKPGQLKYVTVGNDGTAWGINTTNNVYSWSGANWVQQTGSLVQLSVGNAKNIWGVDATDKVYKWSGSSWQSMPGLMKHVSAAADGTVWAVNGQSQVWRWNGSGWIQMSGTLKQISVGSSKVIWGVDATDKVYQWSGTSWTPMSGGLMHISAASDGSVWGVARDNSIWRYNSGGWVREEGSAKQIAVGKFSDIWAVNSANAVIHQDNMTPISLKGISIPSVPGLLKQDTSRIDIVTPIVVNQNAAIALGKYLFWDQAIGSDGNACASCHFHAGADFRIKNQVNPGFTHDNFTFEPTLSGADKSGPNYTLNADDFPFDPKNDDVVSSAGTFGGVFNNADPGNIIDNCARTPDETFNVGGVGVRRVEPRNTPTTINAVFNFRNFWDGRANNIFNGISPFGPRDKAAKILINKNGVISKVNLKLKNSSLASQAVGPVLSILEMSCEERKFGDVGRKVLPRKPLADQSFHPQDSVFSKANGYGDIATYADLVKLAFNPVYWDGNCTSGKCGKPADASAAPYTQMEANFPMFFGLAVQLYESTLVSDDTKFDRWQAGKATFSNEEKLGFDVFNGKGECVNCHGGPVFTSAAIAVNGTELIERMAMKNIGVSIYDEGFYNIGVVPTEFDLGVGGKDPFGNPLSFSKQYVTGNFVDKFSVKTCRFEVPFQPYCDKPTDLSKEQAAVDGSFKVPSLRNVELTGPYFHNGAVSTLEDVVEFYNRGGNVNNLHLHPDIKPLGLNDAEKKGLVAFMKTLTDDRVAYEMGPFDHPSLRVPNGHVGDHKKVEAGNEIDPNLGKDIFLEVPAVGKLGSDRLKTFVDLLPAGKQKDQKFEAYLSAVHSGKCLDLSGASKYDGAKVQQWICNDTSAQKLSFEPVPGKTSVYFLKFLASGKCLDVYGSAAHDGTKLVQWSCHGGLNQQFKLEDSGDGSYYLVAQHSGKVVDVSGISYHSGAVIWQWNKTGGNNQKWYVIRTSIEPVKAADENQRCVFSGVKYVKYGALGNYIFRRFKDGALCSTSTFGYDPIFLVRKSCYVY